MRWQIFPSHYFADYREAWDRLNTSGPNSALLHPDFIEPLLQILAQGDERLAIYGDVTDPQVMALLTQRRFGTWETFQPSQLPLGPWLNQATLPLEQLLQQLSRTLPGPVLSLSITQQDPDFYPRPEHSACLNTLDYIVTARISINGRFEDYWSQRGKNLRQNLNRQRNRLQREKVSVRLETITDPSGVAAAIDAYGKLESAGWKAQEGTAIHSDNAQGRFYTLLLENFCRRGMGRIYQYWYEDKLVATDLCVQRDSVLIILKTTYDETITTSSPAMLMRRDYFEAIFNEGTIHTIEFYGPVMDWHRRLSEDTRVLYHINFHRWPVLEKIRRYCRNSWKRLSDAQA
jgi:CelD/BcsL family acetyltransferase involved in cellulose biosynthesis